MPKKSSDLLNLLKGRVPCVASLALPPRNGDSTLRTVFFLKPGFEPSVSNLTKLWLPLVAPIFVKIGGYELAGPLEVLDATETLEVALKENRHYTKHQVILPFTHNASGNGSVIAMDFDYDFASCGLHYDPEAHSVVIYFYDGD